MSNAEAKLAAFFREGRPKASDAVFRLAVLERRARRQFYFYTAMVIAAGMLAAGCVAAMAPHLSAWTALPPSAATIPFLSVVATGACVLLAYTRTRQTF